MLLKKLRGNGELRDGFKKKLNRWPPQIKCCLSNAQEEQRTEEEEHTYMEGKKKKKSVSGQWHRPHSHSDHILGHGQ